MNYEPGRIEMVTLFAEITSRTPTLTTGDGG